MLQEILRINHAVLPDEGEDSFALRTDEHDTFLCVTDGCGGLGSRRYPELANRTGAYVAARMAARAFAFWADERRPVPQNEEEAKALCAELENDLHDQLKSFAEEHCMGDRTRIVGSMQRCLPTTLCALTVRNDDLCFWWAGDSRGYVMDEDGLHQHTRDHLRGDRDCFENLYNDKPLSNLLSADKKGMIQFKKVKANKPCIAFVATDGVYSCLPTPMEVEMLLLDTLRQSASMADWEKRLARTIARNAQDDATLLLIPLHMESFEQMKEMFMLRRSALQKQFITPVRRHKGDLSYAREKWKMYRQNYDMTENGHE